MEGLISERSNEFDTIITVDKISKPKPDPEGYLTAAKTLGVDPTKCLVFEDAESGTRAGLAAGMEVIVVGNTLTLEQIKSIDPGLKHIKDFTEVEIE